MNRGALLRLLIHWLRQKTSDEKRGTPKMQRAHTNDNSDGLALGPMIEEGSGGRDEADAP
jgi:hypothetical protein